MYLANIYLSAICELDFQWKAQQSMVSPSSTYNNSISFFIDELEIWRSYTNNENKKIAIPPRGQPCYAGTPLVASFDKN